MWGERQVKKPGIWTPRALSPLRAQNAGLLFGREILAATWLILLALAPSIAFCAEPSIRNLNIRGLQIGGTTKIVVDGDDFGAAPRLLLPFAARVELQAGSTDKQATFDVAPEGEVAPGYHHLRVVTDEGVSLPVVITVDRLPQLAFAATVDPAAQPLPIALHGALNGSAILETTFTGQAGQSVLVEVEAQRLGGKLRPVLHLYDAKRRQLAWAWSTPLLSGDARLEAKLPADGQYTVAIHDLEYNGQQPSHFRLRIGQWASVDQVFPPQVAIGQSASVELSGLLKPTRLDLAAANDLGALPIAWPGVELFCGPRPHVEVTSRTQVDEQPAANASPPVGQDLAALPVDVHGRLATPNEEDRYRVSVIPGSKLRLEVFAERLRSLVDVAIVVRNEKGDQLARGEDSPDSLDPLLEYTAPDNVPAIVVGVVDAQGRGGPRANYRLAIDDLTATAQSPEFELVAPAQRVSLRGGGRCVVPIHVDRRGEEGPIELAATNLPAGLRLEGTTIPAGCDGALVTVLRGDAAPAATIGAWQGRGGDGRRRTATVPDFALAGLQPWLASEVAFAATAQPPSEFSVDWRELSPDAGLVLAGKMPLPVKVVRPGGEEFAKSLVRLTLLTSQLPPKNNRQPDTNRTLRAEKPIELAAETVDGELPIIIPTDLPADSYDLCVQAELLDKDKKPVVTAFTPVRRLAVRNPLLLQLTGPDRLEVLLDDKAGATVRVEGTIERREGLTGDVTVELKGLPPGLRADNLTLKPDVTHFAFTLAIPSNAKTGAFPAAQLSVTGTPDPKQGNVRVKSRDVPLTLVLHPALPQP